MKEESEDTFHFPLSTFRFQFSTSPMLDHSQRPSLPKNINPGWRIGIVRSSYYKEEVTGLTEGARSVLLRVGIPEGNIRIYDAPGSFEIPLIGAALARHDQADALIGLGIIVEGETEHARLLAENVARGIMDVQISYQIPFAFEVLYVRDLEDARKRSTGQQNKGAEAATAVLQSLAELSRIHS